MWFSNRRAKQRRHTRMHMLKRGSPLPRHSNPNHTSTNPISSGFTPGSPTTQNSTQQNQIAAAAQTQSQQHQQSLSPSATIAETKTASSPLTVTTSLGTVSSPLLMGTPVMGGDGSAFRSLVPSLLSAQLGLARSYAAAVAVSQVGGGGGTTSSTSTNQSPRPSDSEEEINIDSDEEESNSTTRRQHSSTNLVVSSPLQLTKHDRN